jgi:hypothetical protein
MSAPRSRFYFRVLHCLCALFVVAYVFFDILDLDGSDRPWTRHSPKGAIFLITTVSEAEASWLPDLLLEHGSIANVLVTYPVVLSSFRANEGLRIAGLTLYRRHCCRVALPRSSVPDPFAV